MTGNAGYFEPFHELIDPIRDRLVDGGVQQIPDEELPVMFFQCESVFKQIESQTNEIMEEATRLIEAVRAVGQAIDDEVKRREKLQSDQ